MPLTKLQFKPGINREVTSYLTKGAGATVTKLDFDLAILKDGGGKSTQKAPMMVLPVRCITGLR